MVAADQHEVSAAMSDMSQFLDARRPADLAADPDYTPQHADKVDAAMLHLNSLLAERAVLNTAGQALDASRRAAFEAIRTDAAATVAPRPRPIPHRLLDAWLVNEAARQPHQWLLAEARALARELAELKGDLSEPQTGATIARLPLGDATVPVEYEYEAGEESRTYGPPEDCYEGSPETLTILGVFIAGVWCDPADVVPASVIEGWEQALIDQMEDDRRSAQDDAAEARAADREWA